MAYVLAIGPYDSVFIGPFDTLAKATVYCNKRAKSPVFDFYPMTTQEMKKNMAEFGAIDIESP